MLSSLVAASIIWAHLSYAKYLNGPHEATLTNYDFIIVGGGTAGAVVASRLSESTAKVLVIEAGIETAGEPESVPFDARNLTPNKGPWDWSYVTAPQVALGGRTMDYPRGKVLGGCNFMVFNPGGRDDYDRYAKIAKNDRWSWNSVLPYRKKLERFVAPDRRSEEGRFVPDDHGTYGPLTTTLPLWPTEIDRRIFAATNEVPGFPWIRDMNNGNEIGLGYIFSSMGSEDGLTPANRTTSASAYLFPFVESRKNLDVLIETQVLRVVQTGNEDGVPVFRGVEISAGPNQPIYSINATREVILSAGSIGTPQILMLSGIGNTTELKKAGVEPLVDLPDVGNNLQDHALLPYQWYVNSNSTWEASRSPDVEQEWRDMYHKLGTGPLINTLATQVGWLRVPQNSSIWERHPDPSAGPTCGHYELFFSNGFLGPIQSTPDNGNFFSILVNLATPASRGTIKLQSNSPWVHPIIDPGFYTDPLDLRIVREGFKAMQRFVSAPAFEGYIDRPYLNDPVQTDEEIDAYIRKLTTTVWHPVATASMSSDDSEDGVVNSELAVKKVRGLRVVDASVLPWVPSAHPESAVYTIAEVASDIIRHAYRLRVPVENEVIPTAGVRAYEHVEL